MTMAKTLKVTPDNCMALQNVREIAASLLDILPGEERVVKDLECELHCFSLSSLGRIELAISRKYDPLSSAGCTMASFDLSVAC